MTWALRCTWPVTTTRGSWCTVVAEAMCCGWTGDALKTSVDTSAAKPAARPQAVARVVKVRRVVRRVVRALVIVGSSVDWADAVCASMELSIGSLPPPRERRAMNCSVARRNARDQVGTGPSGSTAAR